MKNLWEIMMGTVLLAVLFMIFGCVSTQSEFEKARKTDTIQAYDQFLRDHPTGEYAKKALKRRLEITFEQIKKLDLIEGYQSFLAKHPNSVFDDQAKRRIAELAYGQAKSKNTIAAYEDFINEASDTEFIAEAKSQIARLREEERIAFTEAIERKSTKKLCEFLRRYPASSHKQEAEQAIEKLSFEEASADGSLDALKAFLAKYGNGSYAAQAREQLAGAALAEADGSDDALIEFIKSYPDSQLVETALEQLKQYEFYKGSHLIPWDQIPTVYAGEASSGEDKYSCGINMRAFSQVPRDHYIGPSLIVGSRRFFKPDTATLTFRQWTTFEDYTVKGMAAVTADGLSFKEDSIVLKPRRGE